MERRCGCGVRRCADAVVGGGLAVVYAAGTVGALVVDIASAMQEQSTGVTQMGEAITQLDQATQQNAALVEETAAASQSLDDQARELVASVAAFQIDRRALQAA